MSYNGGLVQTKTAAGGGATAWGNITGTLSAQTDLETALADAGGDGGSSVMQLAVVSMTAAQILALSSTNPTVLVPAPGVGKAVIPIGLFVRYHSGGTAFSGGGGSLEVGLRGVGGTFDTLTAASLGMNATTDSGYSEVSNYQSGDDLSNFANLDLCFKCTSAAIATAGNGTLKISVLYYTVDVT